MMQQAAAVVAGTVAAIKAARAEDRAGARPAPAAPAVPQPQKAGDPAYLLPGFKVSKIQTTGALIHTVSGGHGPPLLLMHGAPQTHLSWRLVAPELSKSFTVIMPDLRGYGDSSKPADGDNHVNYSKRAMALDHVEVMKHFGFDRFAVAGHDRGGRVAQRLALDFPDKVTKLAVLDIVPTYYLYKNITLDFVRGYPHWFLFIQAAPIPENAITRGDFPGIGAGPGEVGAEYKRIYSDPAAVHGLCEDYRASATIDMTHDAADIDKKITCPVLTLWAEPGTMAGLYKILDIWKERGTNVRGRAMTGGHTLQEGNPTEVLAELRSFFKA
jgi:haloacetate dehalogenase